MKYAACTLAIIASLVTVARGEGGPGPAPAVLAAEAQRVAVMAKVKDTVVAVFAASGQGGGSGVVISPDGYALSNFHVTRPCGNAMKCGMADGRVYDAVIVGLDPTGDVALIKLLDRNDFPCAELGDSDQLRAGDFVFAMGNPFLLATDFQPTATWGIVSGVHRYQPPDGTLLEYADCIQTDASINPGNSGGPLFDAQGRLVGINGRCSFEKRGRVNVGVGYAISINQIKNFLGSLRSGRIVDHATLGATVATEDGSRVLVNNVLEDSDAYRRGLRIDDEIASFGGRAIATANGFKNVLGIFPKGWRVPLSFRRDGKRYDTTVRLAGVHSKEDLIKKTTGGPTMPKQPGPKPKGKGERSAPKLPIPLPLPGLGTPAPMPEIAKQHFEAKHGYANYYFNKLEQQRLWKGWTARTDFKDLCGPWTMAGTLASGAAFRFRLTDGDAVLTAPIGNVEWTAGEKLASSLPPQGSGGLLPALYLWRRLAVEGLAGFGEVYYLGTAPLPGREGLADVLVGSYRGVQCWYYFDPGHGDLLALEFFADEHNDPCEVYFSEFREVDGRQLPGHMEVRFGGEPFGVFQIKDYKFEPAGKKP